MNAVTYISFPRVSGDEPSRQDRHELPNRVFPA